MARPAHLDVRTGAEFVDGHYDHEHQRWPVTLRRPDGTERLLPPMPRSPHHGQRLVMRIPVWDL
ncbi:MAG: hypothetical protein ACR2FQ_12265 [Pseudonocardiaceae bacterium]